MHEGQPHVRNQDGGRSIFDEPSLPKGPFLPDVVKEDMLRKPEAYKGINDKESILFKESKASGGEAGLMDLAYIPAGAPGMLSQLGLQVGFAAGLGEDVGPWGRTALVATPFIGMATRATAAGAGAAVGKANMALGRKITQKAWTETVKNWEKSGHVTPHGVNVNPIVQGGASPGVGGWYQPRLQVSAGRGKGLITEGGEIAMHEQSALQLLKRKMITGKTLKEQLSELKVHESTHGVQDFYTMLRQPLPGQHMKTNPKFGPIEILPRPAAISGVPQTFTRTGHAESIGSLPRIPPKNLTPFGEIAFGMRNPTSLESTKHSLWNNFVKLGAGRPTVKPKDDILGGKDLTTYAKYFARSGEIEARVAPLVHLGGKTQGALSKLGYTKKEIAAMKNEWQANLPIIKKFEYQRMKQGKLPPPSPGRATGYTSKNPLDEESLKKLAKYFGDLNKKLGKK